MNQKKRMARTLSCLILAMSGTAIFLGWMNPAGHGATPEQMERIVLAAAEVVSGAPALRQRRWHSIDVLAVTEPRGGGAMLAATRDDGTWHFHVGRDGMPVRGHPLEGRESTAGPRSILIHLSRPYASEEFLPLQVLGVRALVSSLQESLREMAATLPVRFVVNG